MPRPAVAVSPSSSTTVVTELPRSRADDSADERERLLLCLCDDLWRRPSPSTDSRDSRRRRSRSAERGVRSRSLEERCFGVAGWYGYASKGSSAYSYRGEVLCLGDRSEVGIAAQF